jgi:hypothetical protein
MRREAIGDAGTPLLNSVSFSISAMSRVIHRRVRTVVERVDEEEQDSVDRKVRLLQQSGPASSSVCGCGALLAPLEYEGIGDPACRRALRVLFAFDPAAVRSC